MVSSELIGGLGNQLHCLAAGVACAGTFNTTLELNVNSIKSKYNSSRIFELGHFIKYNFLVPISVNSANKRSLILDGKRNAFDNRKQVVWIDSYEKVDVQISKISDNSILRGQFLDYDWARKAEEFGFPKDILKYADFSLLKSEFTSGHINIHVRLGDYMLNWETFKFVPEEYYLKYINEFYSPGQKLYLFTDDPKNCKKIYPNLFKVSSLVNFNKDVKPLNIMALLSSGSAIIGSNSTFSTWASWFSNANFISTPTPHLKNKWIDTLPREWLRFQL